MEEDVGVWKCGTKWKRKRKRKRKKMKRGFLVVLKHSVTHSHFHFHSEIHTISILSFPFFQHHPSLMLSVSLSNTKHSPEQILKSVKKQVSFFTRSKYIELCCVGCSLSSVPIHACLYLSNLSFLDCLCSYLLYLI